MGMFHLPFHFVRDVKANRIAWNQRQAPSWSIRTVTGKGQRDEDCDQREPDFWFSREFTAAGTERSV
jgi:hypothetical protein